MQKKLAFVLLLGLAACDTGMEAEVKNQAVEFSLRANWSATAAPLAGSGVSATVAIKQFVGDHHEATTTLTGLPSRVYQWRIFRGNCANQTPQAANPAPPTGLLLFSTVQAYPDITTNASGTATIVRAQAGALDSLTAYSVRFRLSQTATNWNGTSPLACGNLQRS